MVRIAPLPDTCLPRAPAGYCFGPHHCADLCGSVAALPGEWCVELVDTAPEGPDIMISPSDGEDTSGPTVIISARFGRFRVDAFQWDAFWEVGEFEAWPDAVRAVRLALLWETAEALSVH